MKALTFASALIISGKICRCIGVSFRSRVIWSAFNGKTDNFNTELLCVKHAKKC